MEKAHREKIILYFFELGITISSILAKTVNELSAPSTAGIYVLLRYSSF